MEIVDDVFKLILPAVVLMSLFSPAHPAPTTPASWVDPCGTSGVSTLAPINLPTPTGSTLGYTLRGIGGIAHRLQDVTERLLPKFVSKRFMNPDIPILLENYRLDNMPEVHPSPQSITSQSEKPISETLLAAYRNLSLVAVHVEQVRLDEITHEDAQFKPDVTTIENQLRDLMCNIDIELIRQQVTIDDHVTRDVMRVEYRNIYVDMIRYQRDYLILRDTKKLAYFLQILFKTLGSQD